MYPFIIISILNSCALLLFCNGVLLIFRVACLENLTAVNLKQYKFYFLIFLFVIKHIANLGFFVTI